jgi:NAD+ diphosphatase
MVGCFGRADPAQTIRLDLDNELESARWFTKAEIRAIMADPEGTIGNRHDPKAFFNVRPLTRCSVLSRRTFSGE